jgi:hypothetical protein
MSEQPLYWLGKSTAAEPLDHFGLETLLRLRHGIECLVVNRSHGVFYGDISLKLLTQKLGFKNVVELDTLESISLPGGEIIAIPFMGEQADLPHGKNRLCSSRRE